MIPNIVQDLRSKNNSANNNANSCILSIDQGTTGTTVLLVQITSGQILGRTTQEFPQHFPKPGWVEHHPEEIWESVQVAVQKAIQNANENIKEKIVIQAIGITNQRETVMVWDKKSGVPVYPAIVWQCRRTHEDCQTLMKNKKAPGIRKKTGLMMDPYFSATKLRWILKNVSGVMKRAKSGELLAGTVDTFLLWKLTAGQIHRTDVSNASRTMLMNIKTGEWDPDLLKEFGIPKTLLPEIRDSAGEFGRTQGLSFLSDGIPITGIAGDQQAALFGQACFSLGEAKCTFGTGSFLVLNTGNKIIFSRHKLLTTVAWRLPGQKMVYALEGGAFMCGALVQWLVDGLDLIHKSSEIEALAQEVPDAQGVEFIPALTGLGAPHWRADVRGQITGITRGTKKAHIARATLDAMALQNAEILLSMEKDLQRRVTSLKVDGGASANNFLMQIQADLMNVEVIRPKMLETTALGVAFLAGIGAGIWQNVTDVRTVWSKDRSFHPRWTKAQRQKRWDSWNAAMRALLLINKNRSVK